MSVFDCSRINPYYSTSGRKFVVEFYEVRYDTIDDFNVNSKAECGQLNLAHVSSWGSM